MLENKEFYMKKIQILNFSLNSNNFKQLLLFTAVIFFITHGYCFLNALYSHDSLMIFQNDGLWQISLGRFLQPFYCRLRGMITAPLWVGTCTFVYLSISIYLIKNLLTDFSKTQVFIVSGVLTTSVTLTLSNATYIPWSDIYMLALLLSTLGAYIAIKQCKYFVVSVICMVLSLGLYQAYIQVAVVLLMFDVFYDVLKNKETKLVIKKAVCYLCVIFAVFALYFCLYKLFLHIYHIPAATGYNGLSNVGHFKSSKNVISYFLGVYFYVWKFFVNPISVHKRLTVFANILLLVAGLSSIIASIVENKLSKINLLFAIVLICLFPFGFNFIYFIAQGMAHELMIYSFSVVPLFILPLVNCLSDEKYMTKLIKAMKVMVFVSFAVIIFNNIIFANQVYVKKDLEAKSTLSIVTRIIDRIEQTEGYVAGETQVKIIGKIEENSAIIEKRAGFKYRGAGNKCWATATYNIEEYIKKYLAYPMRFSYEQVPPP